MSDVIDNENSTLVVKLREVEAGDLALFFEFQLEPEANFMAAFTSKDPADRAAFDAHWARILGDDTIPIKTILVNDRVAGSVLSYVQGGEREVSYWLGKKFWGQGIATQALAMYLEFIQGRPIYARAARDNLGSIRVLEKNGFKLFGIDKGFANSRGEEIEEYIFKLDKRSINCGK